MNKIKVSLDTVGYLSKPKDSTIATISNRIPKNIKLINQDNISAFVSDIALDGYSFCPATFKNGLRRKENFEQQHLFALDFDGKISTSWEDILDRTEQYDLPVLFAYETFTSTNRDKFRVVFLNDIPITNAKAAEIQQNALLMIFPEADASCKDITRMYFGGNKDKLLHFDESMLTIDIESVIRNMTHYLKDKYGGTNYKRKISDFAGNNGIALNERNLLDISKEECSTETIGVDQINKNMPNPFIYIKGFGNNLLSYEYRIKLSDVRTKTYVENNIRRKRTSYRSNVLNDIGNVCQLFREFENGDKPSHDEMAGIANNLIHIEGGVNRFKSILHKNSYFDDRRKKYELWDKHLKHFRQNSHKPQSCSTFCRYIDVCNHSKNILSTIKPKFPVKLVVDYVEEYTLKEEVEKELEQALDKALNTNEHRFSAIYAQTSIGKSQAFIKRMERSKLIIAAPTNDLKQELMDRATDYGIDDIIVSPSLHELDLSNDIQLKINKFYKSGRHKSVVPYIKKVIKSGDAKCADTLKSFLDERDSFYNSNCCAVTTHKNFLHLDGKHLSKYSSAVIDEDLILKALIPGQCEIPLSELEKILKKDALNSALTKKIKLALKCAGTKTYFELPPVEFDYEMLKGISTAVDIPSFCSATRFYCNETSNEKNLLEKNSTNSIIFYQPVELKPKINTVMVSATMNEAICRYVFGDINFFKCQTAKYYGILNQYPAYPMSRTFIDKYPDVFKRIQKLTGIDDIITFKKYLMGILYFGNTDGRDIYKGRNINVVGTPHQPEWMYKLFAYTFGLDFDIDAKLIPNMLVEHNDWRFPFTTYEDPVLRNIQFYMIESELEQAVGRARLLRCNCVVNLFSNFPLRQAVMKEVYY